MHIKNKTAKHLLLGVIFLMGSRQGLRAQAPVVSFSKVASSPFALASPGYTAPIVISAKDDEGVAIAAHNLSEDFNRVTGKEAPLLTLGATKKLGVEDKYVILVGTLGKSDLMDSLVREGLIDVSSVAGKWESTLIQVVDHPLAGVDKALVIAGSDKRGTIYGIYELSRQIGVSPWYYFGDVPTPKHDHIYLLGAGQGSRQVLHSPKVKYRGIFLNDEAPALTGWAKEQFGGFNHQFYVKVFELLLRLKANYLWPAMWGNAFNDDDSLNPVLADTYGIVMGTSHHEPMQRAQQEWKRYGSGAWDYEKNRAVLEDFWTKGIKNMGSHERLVTIGMRGDGDMPMEAGSNISLLEKIVKDQRGIISAVTAKPAAETPQIWALYKEVQDYYDKGMRVPEDVTLLLCDDNWGNLRKLPALDAAPRKGGYGIYYHFDYVGGPRNYKWINTNMIERTWEQMHLAYSYGVDKVWIVNVGDLKFMEYPVSFFLDYARDPDKLPYEALEAYTLGWAKEQFGEKQAAPIAEVLRRYSKYNARVKPELLNSATYSLDHYDEWDEVARDYNQLAEKSSAIYEALPEAYKAAYFGMVDFQVAASANLYNLYRAQALNLKYAAEGRAAANLYADSVAYYYTKDSLLTYRFNKINAAGKWNHMADQTHIGYTYWQQPATNQMPEVKKITLPRKALLGLEAPDTLRLNIAQHEPATSFTLYPKGSLDAHYQISSSSAYLHLSQPAGTVPAGSAGVQIKIALNKDLVPKGATMAAIKIKGGGLNTTLPVILEAGIDMSKAVHNAYIQSGDIISMDATGYQMDQSVMASGVRWQDLPHFGKSAGAITPMPVTFKDFDLAASSDSAAAPSVSYSFYVTKGGEAHLRFYLSPTNNIWSTDGLKFAYSIDGAAATIVNINKGLESSGAWGKEVSNSIKVLTEKLSTLGQGLHRLRVYAVSPAVVLQKIEVDFGSEKKSFLGAPISYFNP